LTTQTTRLQNALMATGRRGNRMRLTQEFAHGRRSAT
jgi:hypothetical protein